MSSNPPIEPAAFAAPLPESQQKSVWSIVVEVFTAPTQAFHSVRQQPRIIIPLVLLVILVGAAGALTAKHGAELQYEIMKTSELMPASALNEMKEAIDNPNYLLGAVSGPIMVIIVGLLEALFAMFLGNFIFAGQASFKQIWSVVLLTAIIVAVGGLLRVPLVYAKDSLLVSIGPAALMPGKDFRSVVFAFAYFIDLFAIWATIAAGIGYSIIFGISRSKGMTISVAGLVIFTSLAVGLQMLGMSFAGVEITFF